MVSVFYLYVCVLGVMVCFFCLLSDGQYDVSVFVVVNVITKFGKKLDMCNRFFLSGSMGKSFSFDSGLCLYLFITHCGRFFGELGLGLLSCCCFCPWDLVCNILGVSAFFGEIMYYL